MTIKELNELKRLIKIWRKTASSNYYQTYKTGKAAGLRAAANSLELCLQKSDQIETLQQPTAGVRPGGYSEAAKVRSDDYSKHY